MKKRIIIFLDIDGVMIVGWKKTKMFPWGFQEPFDKGCVEVLNSIHEIMPVEIVISSDWRDHYSIPTLQKIFDEFGVKPKITDVTPNSKKYVMDDLEGGRSDEINTYIGQHKDEILAWVSVDDLKMYDLEHFVECTKWTEGIKQTGIKEKIVNELKQQING